MAAECGLSNEDYSALLSRVDQLLQEDKVQEICDLLMPYKDKKSPELLWRLASALTEYGRLKKSKSRIYEAASIIERALVLDDSSADVRKVYVNVLRYTGEYEGPKTQVHNSYIIKAHLELAKQLKPDDPSIHYSLGCWSFAFADISRVTRKLAGTTGVKPPKCTYKEAMEHFRKAEELKPGFSAINSYMLGKTLHCMGEDKTAITYLIRARDFTPRVTCDDHEAYKKATKLLGKMSVKK